MSVEMVQMIDDPREVRRLLAAGINRSQGDALVVLIVAQQPPAVVSRGGSSAGQVRVQKEREPRSTRPPQPSGEVSDESRTDYSVLVNQRRT